MSGIDYTPRIYIRDFTVTDYRAFLTTLEYDVVGIDTTLLRDLFFRIPDETAGFLELSGDEQDTGVDVLEYSGDSAGLGVPIQGEANYHVRGFDVTLTIGQILIIDEATTFVLTGNAAQFFRDLFLRATTEAFALSAQAAALRRDLFFRTDVTSFTLTGVSAELDAGLDVELDTGIYVLTGQDVALLRDLFIRITSTGAFILDVRDVGLKRDLFLRITSTGAFALVGTNTDLTVGGEDQLRLSGDQQTGGDGLNTSGDEQSGDDVILLSSAQLLAEVGAFTLTGIDANLRLDVPIELSGDEQDTGTDELKLSGDEQDTGSDVLVTSTS